MSTDLPLAKKQRQLYSEPAYVTQEMLHQMAQRLSKPPPAVAVFGPGTDTHVWKEPYVAQILLKAPNSRRSSLFHLDVARMSLYVRDTVVLGGGAVVHGSDRA